MTALLCLGTCVFGLRNFDLFGLGAYAVRFKNLCRVWFGTSAVFGLRT